MAPHVCSDSESDERLASYGILKSNWLCSEMRDQHLQTLEDAIEAFYQEMRRNSISMTQWAGESANYQHMEEKSNGDGLTALAHKIVEALQNTDDGLLQLLILLKQHVFLNSSDLPPFGGMAAKPSRFSNKPHLYSPLFNLLPPIMAKLPPPSLSTTSRSAMSSNQIKLESNPAKALAKSRTYIQRGHPNKVASRASQTKSGRNAALIFTDNTPKSFAPRTSEEILPIIPVDVHDFSYWIPAEVFNPDLFGTFMYHASYINPHQLTSPYLSCAIEEQFVCPDFATALDAVHDKLANYGSRALYNRYQLRKNAALSTLCDDDKRVLTHFGATVNGERVELWVFQCNDGWMEKWTGCTMRKILAGRLTDTDTLSDVMHILAVVHRWGSTAHFDGLRRDLAALKSGKIVQRG